MTTARRAWLAVGAAVLLAHLRTVTCGFVFDDPYAVAGNPSVTGPLDLAALLGHDFWGLPPGHGVGTWRPLPVLSLWVDWHLGGGAPWIFHATNVALAALAAVALAAASRSALAGVVFGVLAGCCEAVDSIVGRADVMAAGLCFLAWALSRRHMAAAALAYFLALLCKESAIVLPLWLLLVVDDGRPRPRHALLAAALAAYLGLRAATYGLGAGDVLVTANNNPLLVEPLGVRLLTSLALFGRAAALLVFPATLAPDYSFAAILPERGLSPAVAAGALLLAATGAGALLLRRRAPLVARGLAILFVAWLPVANVVVALPTIFAERLLYQPAAGVALALAGGLAALARRARLPALALATLLIGGNLLRSAVRAGDWRDELSLFTAAAEAQPRSARAQTNLGAALRRARQPREALAALGRARAIAPGWALPRSLAGATLDDLGDRAGAERELRIAVALDPDLEDAVFNLGLFLARHGMARDAVPMLEDFVHRHPEREGSARRLLDDIRQRLQ